MLVGHPGRLAAQVELPGPELRDALGLGEALLAGLQRFASGHAIGHVVADRQHGLAAVIVAQHLGGPLDLALLAGAREDRVHVVVHSLPCEPLGKPRADPRVVSPGQEGLEPVLALDLVERVTRQPLEVGVDVLDRALRVERHQHHGGRLEDALAELRVVHRRAVRLPPIPGHG